ncbi:MAG: flagellar secretion chaperone FliS [Campylobacterota bacterium]|nr:flagellar secretion chaperone FliS [Campylobacterota bacterium]
MKETNKDSKKGSKMYGNVAHNIYAQNNVGIESPAKLVEMLYEGVLRFNAQAKKAIRDGNIEKRVYWINRSVAVITELVAVLDMKGGRIAQYLEGLYNYEIQLLNEANLKKDTQKLDEVSNVFKGLLEAWRETTNVAN